MDAEEGEAEELLPRTQEEETYTVDEGVDKIGFGFFQVFIAVFSGFIWGTEAIELTLLSILSVAVKCQWDLSDPEEATITTVVFIGFFLGGLFWGVIFDTIVTVLGKRYILRAIMIFQYKHF